MAYKFQIGSAKLGGAVESTGQIKGSDADFADVTQATVDSIVAEMNSGQLPGAKIEDGGINNARLAADAVDGDKIADNAIDSEHYAAGSIDTEHIADAQITLDKMAADSVDGDKIADNAIDSEHYAGLSIDTEHIADAQITLAKMATNSVDSAQLIAGAVDLAHMSANSVDSAQLIAGAVDLAHMSVDSVGSDQYVNQSILTAHVGNAQITLAKLAADSVDGTKIADDAVNSEHYAAGSIDAEHYALGSVETAALANDAVETAKIRDGNVTLDKMANVADGRFLMGNASNRPVAVAPSGDANISNAGVIAIQAGKVQGSMLNANTVNFAKGTQLDGSQLSLKLNNDALNTSLILESGGLDLKATIGGNRTFSGDMIVSGDLTVNGVTTTLNVSELSVEDANITMAKGATAADGNGLTIGTTGTPVTFMMADSAANLASSVPLKASSFIGDLNGTLVNARNIGGVAFDASVDIVPQLIAVADESVDTSCNVAFFNAATGDQQAKTGTNLTFDSAAGSLAATEFVGGGAGLTGVTVRDVVVTRTSTDTLTIQSSDVFRTILIDASSGNVRMTLPAAGGVNSGKIFKFKRIDVSGNDCEVAPASSEKLEFAVDQILALQTQGAAVSCVSNGTDWFAM